MQQFTGRGFTDGTIRKAHEALDLNIRDARKQLESAQMVLEHLKDSAEDLELDVDSIDAQNSLIEDALDILSKLERL